MLYKLNATSKLYLLVFVMCVFIIGTGVYGIIEMKTMRHSTQTLYADRVVPLQQLTNIRYSYAVGIISSAEQVQTAEFTYSHAIDQIQQSENNIATNWKAYMLTYLTPEEEQLAKQASVLMNKSKESIEKLKDILNKRDAPGLDKIINNDLYAAINPTIAKLNELVDLQVRVSAELYKNSNEVYSNTIKKSLLLIVLLLLFAVPFSYYLIRNIKDLIKDLWESNEKTTESEKKYRSLIEHAGDPIFMVAEDNSIIDVNKSACELLGYSRSELQSMKAWDVYPPDELREPPVQWDLLRQNKTLLNERRLQRKDGTKVEVEISRKILDSNGYLAIVRDITERKKTEEILTESEKKYRNIFENVQDVFFQTSLAGVVLEASPSFKTHTGISREEVIGTPVINLYYDDRDRDKGLDVLREKGEMTDYEMRLKSRAGDPVYVSLNARLVPGADGKLSHIDGMFRNITERKKAEEKLKHSEARLKEAQAIARTGNWEIDMLNDIHVWSDESYKIFGVSKDEVMPSTQALLSFVHPDDREGAQQLINYAFETLIDASAKFRFTRKGEDVVRYGLIEWRFEFNENKKPVRLYGIIQDITERKKAEESIKQSEANYRQLFNLSPAPMWVCDEGTYKFIQVNQACVNDYGYSEEEFLGMTVENILPKSEGDDIKNDGIKKNQANGFFMSGHRHIKKSGELMDVETSSIPVVLNGKKQILVVAIDVTEKNLYEQKLTRAAIKAQEEERYEIGGELHDNVCQILAASQLFLGMIKKDLPSDSQNYFERTKKAILLASQEVRNLSHRLAPAFFDDATLEDAFKNLLKGINVENKYEINLDFDKGSKGMLLGREQQLNLYRILQEQLRNILKHAIATRIDVTVTINNNTLQMRIADNGIGFDVKSNSPGIGLASMHRRAQLFSGTLRVYSAVGHGCTVLVDMPVGELIINN